MDLLVAIWVKTEALIGLTQDLIYSLADFVG
jgi:hypothetical protein